MNSRESVRGPQGLLSVAVLGLFLAQSCFQVEMTTRMEPGGSGQLTLQMSASTAVLEMGGQEGEMSGEDLQFSEEEIREMRGTADTLPGIHFDTAYSTQDPQRTGLFVQFSFDSVDAVQGVLERRGTDRFTFPTLRQAGRTVSLRYLPDPALASEEAGQEGPFAGVGREMLLQVLDVRFRYVFPTGTRVDTAYPPVRRTDSTVVYEWGMREVMEASEEGDSLFVAARLPAGGGGAGLWIVLGAVLIVGGGIVVLLLARSR